MHNSVLEMQKILGCFAASSTTELFITEGKMKEVQVYHNMLQDRAAQQLKLKLDAGWGKRTRK